MNVNVKFKKIITMKINPEKTLVAMQSQSKIVKYSKDYGTLCTKLLKKKSNLGSLGAYLLSFTISQHGSTEPSSSTAVLRLWCVC